MKKLLVAGAIIAVHFLFAETPEEAYARVSACRDVWNTNAWAYVKQVAIGDDQALAEAKAKWFVDVLGFPDVTETNRLGDVLYAKEKFLCWNTDLGGIIVNTNCWYAVADFIARLKAASDPRWIDKSYIVEIGRMADGARLVANTNPLLDFASYKLAHYENYRERHKNIVNDTDVFNAFCREWSDGIRARQEKERTLKRAQDYAKYQTLRDRFWLFGAKNLPPEIKAICRSNIVERAHLTAEEERDIFEYVPHWYYRVMGIKQKKKETQ